MVRGDSFVPGVLEDGDVSLAVELDPTNRHGIALRVTNKTERVLQVNWRSVTLRDPSGAVIRPRPEVDVGWVEPGQTLSTVLSPFSLPSGGLAAHAYEGERFELTVPTVVRSEPKSYVWAFVASVADVDPATSTSKTE